MSTPSPDAAQLRRPHPLADALIIRLGAHRESSVIDLGAGSGRNSDALRAAGFSVLSVPDSQTGTEFSRDARSFDAALSTHALLHGTPQSVSRAVETLAMLLRPGAFFHATFASKRDARYGKGRAVAEETFVDDAGDEPGVPHVFFDEPALRGIVEPFFNIESLEEHDVDTIVGRWAHARRPSGSVHWFLRSVRRN